MAPDIELNEMSRRAEDDPVRCAVTSPAMVLALKRIEAHYQLGRSWLESGDAQKAIAELLKANTLRSDNPEIHFALARAYAKAGLPQKAAAERATFMQLKAMAAVNSQHSTAGESVLQSNSQPQQN